MARPQPESRLVARIRHELDRRGWLTWKNHGGPMSPAGLPDVMAVRNGRLLAVEVKQPGKSPTAIQRLWLERLAAHGAIVAVANGEADVVAAIERAEASSCASGGDEREGRGA